MALPVPGREPDALTAVSYTHLDVYKRQVSGRSPDRWRSGKSRWYPGAGAYQAHQCGVQMCIRDRFLFVLDSVSVLGQLDGIENLRLTYAPYPQVAADVVYDDAVFHELDVYKRQALVTSDIFVGSWYTTHNQYG